MANTPGDFKKGHKVNAMDPKKLKKIADDLVKWSEDPSSCHLVGFTRKHRRTRQWLYDLAEDHECIRDSLAIARENLAHNYVSKGLDGTWAANLASRWAPIYDKEIDAHEIARIKLKAQAAEAEKEDTHIHVHTYADKPKD